MLSGLRRIQQGMNWILDNFQGCLGPIGYQSGMSETLTLPMQSKWACLFSLKGRARWLDMFKIYADGSFDRYPYGSICLDVPLTLLRPDMEKSVRLRPSDIARACDLFPDPACYKFLEMIENDLITTNRYMAEKHLFFVMSEVDERYMPKAIVGLDYGEALAQLRNINQPAPRP